MAMTLVEAAKLALNAGAVVQSSVIEMFARASDILRTIPFENIAGNALKYNQEATLPGIAFRGVNEAYTESVGVINPKVEALYIAGGDLDVDAFIIKTMGLGVRSTHENMKVKALAADWTRAFIKGDSETQPREFDGLQKRLTGSQLIANGASSGGDVLSLAKLDETIDAVDAPTHVIMSKAMRRALTVAQRTTTVGGYVTFGTDEFGRQITMYNGLPILVPYSENGGTEPLAFDEANPGGGSAVGQSIYVVSFGSARLQGIQSGPMEVRDLGELQTTPAWRTRVEWYPGIALLHGRAAARLYGIKAGAVVA